AEDGIRDRTVTGVQTCALPIYVDVGDRRSGRVQHGAVHRPRGLAFLPLRGQAQPPGAVYGTVLDTAGAPIADVHISTAGAAAASDAAGHYRVTGIRPGRAVLRFARLGYRVAQDTVAVPAGDSVRLDVTLRSSR